MMLYEKIRKISNYEISEIINRSDNKWRMWLCRSPLERVFLSLPPPLERKRTHWDKFNQPFSVVVNRKVDKEGNVTIYLKCILNGSERSVKKSSYLYQEGKMETTFNKRMKTQC